MLRQMVDEQQFGREVPLPHAHRTVDAAGGAIGGAPPLTAPSAGAMLGQGPKRCDRGDALGQAGRRDVRHRRPPDRVSCPRLMAGARSGGSSLKLRHDGVETAPAAAARWLPRAWSLPLEGEVHPLVLSAALGRNAVRKSVICRVGYAKSRQRRHSAPRGQEEPEKALRGAVGLDFAYRLA